MNRKYLGSITKYGVIGEGNFSRVYECDYLDSFFAYKEFINKEYVKHINDRIITLSQITDYDFVFPYQVIYKNPNDNNFIGYVMNCLYDYKKLSDLYNLEYDEKLNILKKSRELIEKFHNKYNFIHTDICPWNIMYNRENNDVKLIDFDSYIDLKNIDKYLGDYYSCYAQDYGNKIGVDKDLDMFLFNLTTYSWLNNIEYNDVLNVINNSNININSEHARKVIESYKNIECNKTLKKEYIIDYL